MNLIQCQLNFVFASNPRADACKCACMLWLCVFMSFDVIILFQTHWTMAHACQSAAAAVDLNKVWWEIMIISWSCSYRTPPCCHLTMFTQFDHSCTFSVITAPWSAPWISSLNLRFRKPTSKPALPFDVLPLFNGGCNFFLHENCWFV